VNVTVTHPGARRTLSYATAVAVVAAGLRAGHTVTVHTTDQPTRWALTAAHRRITARAVNPDLFTSTITPPAWVERLAAAAAPLL
jgi:hypothetical protein